MEPEDYTVTRRHRFAAGESSAEVGEAERSLVQAAFSLYTTKSPEALVTTLRERYREDATFQDPLVATQSRHGIELQFFSLQKLFEGVELSAKDPVVRPMHGAEEPGLVEVAVENRQVYRLSRPGRFRAWLLPESVTLEVTTYLTIDQKVERVLHHEDTWHSPRLPLLLPRFARRANAAVLNGAFGLLGWGRRLAEVETHPKSD